MSDQRPLFDVERTQPAACPVRGCAAIRTPGQDRVPTCDHDRGLALNGYREGLYRPRGCLNYPKPQHEPIPY